MIIRLFQAKVKPGKQADFKKTLELLSIPKIHSSNGMIAFNPGHLRQYQWRQRGRLGAGP